MPRTAAWTEINQMIHAGRDPYDGFHAGRLVADHQGWNSHHAFLRDAIVTSRPRVVVEVGVWKGGSSIYMAEIMREQGIDGTIISVDTWLGSWEHYEQEVHFADLYLDNGYPTLYYTFLNNVLDRSVQDYIVPLPLDSANAAFVVQRKGIKPDVIHIDAGHDYKAVRNDLDLWWSVLPPGGTIVADDYDPEGRVWPTVRDAVDDFLKETPHQAFEAVPYKARFRKPAAS